MWIPGDDRRAEMCRRQLTYTTIHQICGERNQYSWKERLVHHVNLSDIADVHTAARGSKISMTLPHPHGVTTQRPNWHQGETSWKYFFMFFVSKRWDSHITTLFLIADYPHSDMAEQVQRAWNTKQGERISHNMLLRTASWDSDHHIWPFYGVSLLCWSLQLINGYLNREQLPVFQCEHWGSSCLSSGGS